MRRARHTQQRIRGDLRRLNGDDSQTGGADCRVARLVTPSDATAITAFMPPQEARARPCHLSAVRWRRICRELATTLSAEPRPRPLGIGHGLWPNAIECHLVALEPRRLGNAGAARGQQRVRSRPLRPVPGSDRRLRNDSQPAPLEVASRPRRFEAGKPSEPCPVLSVRASVFPLGLAKPQAITDMPPAACQRPRALLRAPNRTRYRFVERRPDWRS